MLSSIGEFGGRATYLGSTLISPLARDRKCAEDDSGSRENAEADEGRGIKLLPDFPDFPAVE
jgi:hypothetical protein